MAVSLSKKSQKWFQSTVGKPTAAQLACWQSISQGKDTLLAAPTGSGKTLAAFMVCLDGLLQQACAEGLSSGPQVLYVSPLKALSYDIEKNLNEPLRQLEEVFGLASQTITVFTRTGDTPSRDRARMLRQPPQIIVTTPESLFLLISAPRSRELLRYIKTVIVDEIHALVEDKRGLHLFLSLARLSKICHQPPQRIGLSATIKPLSEVANMLVGGQGQCEVLAFGHMRQWQLELRKPPGPLVDVCTHEQWDVVYKELAQDIAANRSTLIFVNTRQMAERLALRLKGYLLTACAGFARKLANPLSRPVSRSRPSGVPLPQGL